MVGANAPPLRDSPSASAVFVAAVLALSFAVTGLGGRLGLSWRSNTHGSLGWRLLTITLRLLRRLRLGGCLLLLRGTFGLALGAGSLLLRRLLLLQLAGGLLLDLLLLELLRALRRLLLELGWILRRLLRVG